MSRYFQERSLGKNKRARTRSLLLDCAVSVMSKNGIREAKIENITQLAGLTNATFYNHFRDKRELVSETVMAITVEVTRLLDEEMHCVHDADTRVVVATSRFLYMAVDDRAWGPILLEAFYLLSEWHVEIGQYIKADIQRGVDQGVFDVTCDELIVEQAESLIMSGLRMLTDEETRTERIKATTIQRICENVLRLLGMTPANARAAIRRAQVTLDKY